MVKSCVAAIFALTEEEEKVCFKQKKVLEGLSSSKKKKNKRTFNIAVTAEVVCLINANKNF